LDYISEHHQEARNRVEAEFAKAQEAAQKDIERAFDVLQTRFVIDREPARFWDMDTLKDIMTTRVILHNMIITDVCTRVKPSKKSR
jgi:hypothetical protein